MFGLFEKLNFDKYKEKLENVKELKLFKDEGVFKVNLKLEDGTELTTPLSNYKTIIDTVTNKKSK